MNFILFLITLLCMDWLIDWQTSRQISAELCVWVCIHMYQCLECVFGEKSLKSLHLSCTEKVQHHRRKVWKHEITGNCTKYGMFVHTYDQSPSRQNMWQFILSIMQNQYLNNTLKVIPSSNLSLRTCWDPVLQCSASQNHQTDTMIPTF